MAESREGDAPAGLDGGEEWDRLALSAMPGISRRGALAVQRSAAMGTSCG